MPFPALPGPLAPLTALFAALLSAPAAHAFNYHELEVYPYRTTAAKGELEIENATTDTAQGTQQPADGNNGLTRSSVELTYGLTNHLEFSAYGDFNHARGSDGL